MKKVLFVVGDPWMVFPTAVPKNERKHKLVFYLPIDGFPLMKKWIPVLRCADMVVAYGKFGTKVIKTATDKVRLAEINHGVDTDVFFPLSEKERT